MMLHSLLKECRVLLCEAVQGDVHVYFTYLSYVTYVGYVIQHDPGYEQDHWKKRKNPPEEEEPLRAHHWHYKSMNGERDEPKQSSN